MKLSISRKLLLGYLLMALLTVMAGAYALYSLQQLSSVATKITAHHYVLLENSKKMIDLLLAQENAEKKYLILKDRVLEDIFRQRSLEFRDELARMRALNLDGKTLRALANLDVLHRRLQELFGEEVALVEQGLGIDAQALSDTTGKAVVEEMALALRHIQKTAEMAVSRDMTAIARQGATAVNITLGLGLLSLLLGITLALVITRNISKPLQQLQRATALIAEGKLHHKISARRDDEIGALAKSFAHMTGRLRELEALNLDASPLTGLPGNLAIEHRIQALLTQEKLFSLAHVDLDNFKPFADKYGYAWGSEVIKAVANLLQGYIPPEEVENYFVGHIGGDDYVVIGAPERVLDLCQKLVRNFEAHIHGFFGPEDAANGFLMGKNRQGVLQKHPLITVTAAIVTDDGSRFQNPLEMARVAAELKEYAKTLSGSNCVTEKDMEPACASPHDLTNGS